MKSLICRDEDLGQFKVAIPMQLEEGARQIETGNTITSAIDATGRLRVWHNYPRQNENEVITLNGYSNGFVKLKHNMMCALDDLNIFTCYRQDENELGDK